MKKTIYFLAGLMIIATAMLSGLTSCASEPETSGMGQVSDSIKKPVLIDHKNLKWSKDAPTWVSKEVSELEAQPKYADLYIFKFESPRSKSLEGAELWTRDFSVPSEMARMVKMRVESKAVAAAAGDKDLITGYLEDIVKTLTDTKLSGFKKETDYWIQQRYFDAEGEPAGDDYTYLVLYSIPKKTLNRLIDNAITGADEVKPKTEEEKRVRDLVKESIKDGI
ncbi:MAG: hypothetical protein CR988_06005 [Treponema sp.]|nr:MAG: hypothetical protein CR988_06005 [Treponema sp.]